MAAAAVKPGFGTLFQMKIPAGGSYTSILEVVSINGLELQKDTIDVTHMESPAMLGAAGNAPIEEVIGSIVRLQPVTLGCNYLPSNSTHQALYEQSMATNTPDAFRIIWKGDNTSTPVYPTIFEGIVTGFAPSAEVGGKTEVQVTIKPVASNLSLPT